MEIVCMNVQEKKRTWSSWEEKHIFKFVSLRGNVEKDVTGIRMF